MLPSFNQHNPLGNRSAALPRANGSSVWPALRNKAILASAILTMIHECFPKKDMPLQTGRLELAVGRQSIRGPSGKVSTPDAFILLRHRLVMPSDNGRPVSADGMGDILCLAPWSNRGPLPRNRAVGTDSQRDKRRRIGPWSSSPFLRPRGVAPGRDRA